MKMKMKITNHIISISKHNYIPLQASECPLVEYSKSLKITRRQKQHTT